MAGGCESVRAGAHFPTFYRHFIDIFQHFINIFQHSVGRFQAGHPDRAFLNDQMVHKRAGEGCC